MRNPNHETDHMEVHHHAHHEGKKNWRSYFWEFLMLFLAVFCGFLAENQREHIVEHDREKQYMQSLFTSLKKDTSFYNRFIDGISERYKLLDSILNMVNSRQYLADPKKFYELASGSRGTLYFQSPNSAFEQIWSSGNLRLIRNRRLADSIVNYYNVIQERVRDHESRDMQATANIAAAMWDVLDSKYYILDTLNEGKTFSDPSVSEDVNTKSIDERKLLKYKNLCYEKMLITRPFRGFAIELTEKATNLLLLLKDEYHFE